MPGTPAVKPLYVLLGDDPFLRDRHRRRIVSAIVGDADTDLAVTTMEGAVEPAELFDALRTGSLLAARRAVLLREAAAFLADQDRRDALLKYLDHPAASGSLVLLVDAWRSSKATKALAAAGEVVDCSTPDETQLPAWVREAAAERGKKIAPAVAGQLAAWCGSDLARLDGEVEKLSLYVGDREEITAEDVGLLVFAESTCGDWDLVNAIDRRQIGRALTALAATMTTRGVEFRLLGQLAWHCRRKAGSRGGSRAASDLRRLLAADLALKSSADPAVTMQRLVMELCL
jgi:DNA polymerase-3 subunit delta